MAVICTFISAVLPTTAARNEYSLIRITINQSDIHLHRRKMLDVALRRLYLLQRNKLGYNK